MMRRILAILAVWRGLPAKVAALELRIRELEERAQRIDRLIVNLPSDLAGRAPAHRAERVQPRKWTDFRQAVEDGASREA